MAQNLILCQLCEKPKEISWKCFICDLVLCEKCVKRHSKFGGSEKHCIIDLKKVGIPENVDIIQRCNLKNILCASHEEEKCSFFCKDCKKPVCSFCVLEPEHKGHNLDKLSTVYNNQLSELKDMKKEIEKALPDLTKSVRESTNTCDNYNEIKQKIIQQEKELQIKVAEEAANLINKLDKLVIPSKDAFMEEKQRIQESENKLKEMKSQIDTALQSHQATDVLATIDKIDKHLPLKINSDNFPLEQNFTFIVPDSLLSINLGSLKKRPILNVIKTYETNVSGIYNLKSLKDGTLVCIYDPIEVETEIKIHARFFIGYCDEQGEKYIIKNNILVSLAPTTWKLLDMTVTEDDLILMTNYFFYKIRCCNAYDKEMKTFEDSNYWPEPSLSSRSCVKGNGHHLVKEIGRTGILSFDQTILVPFRESIVGLEYGQERTSIMILDKNGYCSKILRNTDKDNDIKMIPIINEITINKLTTNINGDINMISSKSVITFDSNFKFKWSWENPVFLRDILTTQNGQVVVTDDNSIHILTMDGDFITSNGKKLGINQPRCIHIDSRGQLLVGCEGNENKCAKIHALNIFD